jgi:hypothetical protein
VSENDEERPWENSPETHTKGLMGWDLTEVGHKALLPSHHLVTHTVAVGMTGSGKTGLLIVMIEEALRDGIPCLVVDVKGDLPNLLLRFPHPTAEALIPWVEHHAAPNDTRTSRQRAEAAAKPTAPPRPSTSGALPMHRGSLPVDRSRVTRQVGWIPLSRGHATQEQREGRRDALIPRPVQERLRVPIARPLREFGLQSFLWAHATHCVRQLGGEFAEAMISEQPGWKPRQWQELKWSERVRIRTGFGVSIV